MSLLTETGPRARSHGCALVTSNERSLDGLKLTGIPEHWPMSTTTFPGFPGFRVGGPGCHSFVRGSARNAEDAIASSNAATSFLVLRSPNCSKYGVPASARMQVDPLSCTATLRVAGQPQAVLASADAPSYVTSSPWRLRSSLQSCTSNYTLNDLKFLCAAMIFAWPNAVPAQRRERRHEQREPEQTADGRRTADSGHARQWTERTIW